MYAYIAILRQSYIMCKQFVKQIQLARPPHSSPPPSPHPGWLSQVMCQKESEMQKADGDSDWDWQQVDLARQPVRLLISLWQSDDPLSVSPTNGLSLPSVCKQMHSKLFATCSNIIKFQNRLTARGAANCFCLLFLNSSSRDLSLSLSRLLLLLLFLLLLLGKCEN